jgi:hypothetical protein
MRTTMRGDNNKPGRRTSETTSGGGTKGFAKTGKAARTQFEPKTPGQVERGFRVKTQKQATAAMQGRPPESTGAGTSKPKNKGNRQFTNAPGKKVF